MVSGRLVGGSVVGGSVVGGFNKTLLYVNYCLNFLLLS